MRKVLPILAVLIAASSFLSILHAQAVTLRGTVTDAQTGLGLPAISVIVQGTNSGTYTDDNGRFELTTSQSLPFTILVSGINYSAREVTVSQPTADLNVALEPAISLGQEVVVSATRTPSRILESPVSIERVSNAQIRTAAAPTYYDMVHNLKGVDMVTSSLNFRTPTTRGFGGSGNTRFNQLMDGMDNQAPGLNFSVGSIIGMSELDVDNFELLQGASSALYGPGGMNGTLLINSKSPFKYQGLSAQVKAGMMHVDNRHRDASPYYNAALRWAEAINNKFGIKIGAEMIQAQDWVAPDYRNYSRLGTSGRVINGTRDTDPNYDGVNVYGDETTIDIRSMVLNRVAEAAPFMADYISTLPGTINVSRTGYREVDIVDPTTKILKLSGALHYKLTENLEAVAAGHWGTGNTVYTGAQRYSLRGFKIGQYKVELNSKNWFLRAFTTQENSGETHDLTVTTRLFNEQWKPSEQWYQEYAMAYLNTRMGGASDMAAHAAGRAIADQGRPAAGSSEFNTIFDQVRAIPIPQGGLFLDRSDMYWAEGQFNISQMAGFDFVEMIVGGNWRQFVLNSQGTLFMKEEENIRINELGAYMQLAKDLIPDLLRLTASGRYDKNENFEGRFTPRVTLLVKAAQDHNLRFSYQTAYRFPSTQQQWIDLFVGSGRLIGENRKLWEKYDLINNAPFSVANLSERVNYVQTKPESVTSFEVGYKGLIASKLLLDIYGYHGSYQNFITRRDVIQFPNGTPGPLNTGTGYSVVVNVPDQVRTYGWGFGADYLLPANYRLGVNVSGDVLEEIADQSYRPGFNTPRVRTNVTLGKDGIGNKKLLGFDIAYRWQDGFYYQSDFANGDIPAFHNLDASINFKVPRIKSLIKVGGTNILNQYYITGMGNPAIGGLYYVSVGYNVL